MPDQVRHDGNGRSVVEVVTVDIGGTHARFAIAEVADGLTSPFERALFLAAESLAKLLDLEPPT